MTAPPLANLINELSKLPGVGGKSASRIAYYILKRTAGEAESLANAIVDVKAKIFRCSTCNNMTDVPSIDKEFVTKSLTDNNYKGPEDVVKALLNKV